MLVRTPNNPNPPPLLSLSHLPFSWFSSPTSDGAGAAVLASEAFVRKHGLEAQAVEIVAQAMTTDTSSTFEENSCIKMVCVCRGGGGPDVLFLTPPPRPSRWGTT